LLIGEMGTGAVTFSVDPSASAASAAPDAALDGDIGEFARPPHANASAKSATRLVIANVRRCIDFS
jgi:hypothetical protein